MRNSDVQVVWAAETLRGELVRKWSTDVDPRDAERRLNAITLAPWTNSRSAPYDSKSHDLFTLGSQLAALAQTFQIGFLPAGIEKTGLLFNIGRTDIRPVTGRLRMTTDLVNHQQTLCQQFLDHFF
jgi:hypothetical protein